MRPLHRRHELAQRISSVVLGTERESRSLSASPPCRATCRRRLAPTRADRVAGSNSGSIRQLGPPDVARHRVLGLPRQAGLPAVAAWRCPCPATGPDGLARPSAM